MPVEVDYDSRECASGKTINGIIPMILGSPTTKYLLVLGSIELQNQYKSYLKSKIKIINSGDKNSTKTVDRTIQELKAGTKIIAITHQTFLMLPDSSFRATYKIIIDESLPNIWVRNQINECKVSDKFYDYFTWELINKTTVIDAQSTVGNVFHQSMWVDPSQSTILTSSKLYQKLIDPNYDHYISESNWNLFKNQKSFVIFSLLNLNIFNGWKGIYIAAANFEYTPLFMLFKKYNVKLNCLHKFNKHKIPINIFHPENNMLWSINKLEQYPNIINYFNTIVTTAIDGRTCISLRNNIDSSKIKNEVSLSHNVHGLNNTDWMRSSDIILAAALNLTVDLEIFIKETLLHDLLESSCEKYIRHWTTSQKFYQSIMRSSVRVSNSPIHVFMLDKTNAFELSDYFDGPSFVSFTIPTLCFETELTKTKKINNLDRILDKYLKLLRLSRPMTSSERNNKSRWKKLLDLAGYDLKKFL